MNTERSEALSIINTLETLIDHQRSRLGLLLHGRCGMAQRQSPISTFIDHISISGSVLLPIFRKCDDGWHCGQRLIRYSYL